MEMKNFKEAKIGQYNIFLGGLSEKGINKKRNQDAYRIGIDENKEFAYIIVADGLGSCEFSDIGSSRVVEIIEDWILNKLSNYSFLSDNVANILIKRIVEAWNSSFESNEIHEYDTTVHLALFFKGRFLLGGIGDGMVLVDADDIIHKDLIKDNDLFSNVTNSMCSLNVEELLEFEILSEVSCQEKISIIIATDGISDDLIPEKKLTLPRYFIESINKDGIKGLQDELKDWLMNWETEGHSDDKTLCYLVVEKEVS